VAFLFRRGDRPSMTVDTGEWSLSDRIVLLGLAGLAMDGEAPAHTGQVCRACEDYLDQVEAEVVGSVSEAEVNRALNRLEAGGYVEAIKSDDTSAVGKGRPQFRLADDPEAVVDSLADDDAVGTLATRLRQSA